MYSEAALKQPPLRAQLWRILVRPNDADEVSSGGIYIPPEAQEAQTYNTTVCQVLQVGPEAYDGHTKSGIDLSRVEKVKPGDWVVIGAYAGQSIELKDGSRYRFITADMVLATTDNPDAFTRYI